MRRLDSFFHIDGVDSTTQQLADKELLVLICYL